MRVARGVAIGLGVLIALVLIAVFVFTNTDWGRQRVQGILVGQVQNLLADGAVIEVERLEGGLLSGALLTGLVVRQDGELAATIDTVRISYNLATLLNRRFSSDALYIGAPTVYARQRADSTWNVAYLLKPTDPDKPPGKPFVVHIDSFGVKRGRVEARFLSATRDSMIVVEDLFVDGSGFHVEPDSFTARFDRLQLQATAPNDTARFELDAAGLYTGTAFALDIERLTSTNGTDIQGEAEVRFDGAGGLPPISADLALQPLALADVRAFTGAEVYGDPRLRVQARPRGEDIVFTVQGAISGGTVSLDGALDGALRSSTSGRVAYRVEGQVRGIDPSVITRNDALVSTINADLQVAVEGTSPRTLDGPFELLLTDSRIGQRTVERVRVDGAFRTGRVQFTADAAIPGAVFEAEGEARPFDPTPTYDVRGYAEEFDLDRLLGRSGQTLAFSGTFAVNGAGFTPDAAIAEARVEFDNVRAGSVALDYFDANATLRNGDLRFIAATEVAGGGGTVEAAGTAQLSSDPLAYTITNGVVDDLDLAKLTGDPSRQSDLSGTFALSGRGFDPQTSTIEIQAALRNSSYGVPVGADGEGGLFLDLAALDFDGTLQGGVLGFDTAADLGRTGYLEAIGTARPFADVISYDARGRVEHLDLAELTGNPARQSDITTAFRASGIGTDPETLTLTARLDVGRSSYGAQEVTGGSLDLTLRDGALSLTGDLETAEGSFALNVSGRPFDGTPSFALGDGTCFRGLDLAALTGNPSLRSRLTGCFRGDLSGFDLATAKGNGVVTLRGGSFNDATVEDGRIGFRLLDGRVGADASLTLSDREGRPAGSLDLTFNGRPFAKTPTYALAGSTDALDTGALLGIDQKARVTLRFDVEGRGYDPETMMLTGSFAGGESFIGTAAVDTLRTDFALDEGVLTVDTLFVRSNIADAAGGGRLVLTDRAEAPSSAFRLHADIENLAPLTPYLPQPITLAEASVDVEVTGDPGGPLMFDVATVAERLAYGTTAVSGLDGRLTGSLSPVTGAVDLRTRLEFDYFSQPGVLVEEGDLDVVYTGDEVTIEGDITLDRTRDFQFFTRLDFAAEAPAVDIERFTVNVDGEPWALEGPARIFYGDAYRVQNLLLRSQTGTSQIAADGVIDPDGDQAFVLTIEDLAIDGLTDLAGYEGLGGKLTTSLLMTGTAQNPEIAGTLQLNEFTSRNREVGSVDVSVDYGDSRLGLDARLIHVSGQDLTANGLLPVRFSLADATDETETAFSEGEGGDPVRFEVRADSFPVAWARPFLDPGAYTALGGTLTADVVVGGTQSNPRLDGEARLADGRLGLAAVGRIYETISATLRFDGNQALIEEARITDPQSGEVKLTAGGSITLPKLSVGELNLTVTPLGFTATDTPTYDGLVLDRAAEPIRLTGTLDRPVLRGAVALARGDIYLTDELVAPAFEDVTLTDEQLRIVESRFGRRVTSRDTSVSRFVQALDLDLRAEIERNVWIRSTSGLPFDIEFRGDVNAVKAPFAEGTNLYGIVEVTRGSIQTLGRRFELQGGTLVFNGPTEETEVNLEATLDIRTDPEVGTTAVQITLLVDGRFGEDLTLTLSSDPALDNADIVSLIATGRLAEDFVGGSALAGAGIGFGFSQLAGIVEGAAANAGLDVVQIDQEPGGLVIRLGKYLTSKTFLTVGLPLGGTEEGFGGEVALEYALLQWLLGQVEYQNSAGNGVGSSIGVGAIYEYTY